jgi:type I restriction enzyme S subunit
MPDNLKKGWNRVAFGDVVERVDETGVPTSDESRTYIGLEHLDSDSYTVTKWGSEVDLVVPKTRIKKGDVLFARRNTHLKRCAVAPFDTYFSPDGYAFRSKSPALLQDVLLYIVASNDFMNFAIQHSAGTHSKRVKWSDLVRFEFALPPLDEQRRIAEVLGSVQLAMECSRGIEDSLEAMFASWLDVQLCNSVSSCTLGDILKSTEYGSSARANSKQHGVPILRIPNVLRDELDLSNLKWVDLSKVETTKYLLHPGDILIVRTNGNPSYVGRCLVVPPLPEAMVYASYLIRLVVDPSRVRPEYVANVLNSPRIRYELRGSVRSSAGNFNINTEGIRCIKIPIPHIVEQDRIIEGIMALKRSHNRCHERCRELVAIHRTVLEGLRFE